MAKAKSEYENRVTTYLDRPTFLWLTKEASKLGVKESVYIRMMIIKQKEQMA